MNNMAGNGGFCRGLMPVAVSRRSQNKKQVKNRSKTSRKQAENILDIQWVESYCHPKPTKRAKGGPMLSEGEGVASEILGKMLGDEDSVSGGFQCGIVAEPKYQPVNPATHECLRGPCRYLWNMTARFGETDIGDKVQIKHVSQCNAHYEPTDLTEENIYHCGLWWPAPLAWMPLSLQAVLRPRLRRAWEWWLKQNGYDFSWKHWPDNVFESKTKSGTPKP